MNRKYVQILKGKANLIVIKEDKVIELQLAGVEIINITNLIPQPQTGWLYNSVTQIFSKPLDPNPNTNITNNSLWNRFSEAEQENLVDSANKKIKKFLYGLKIRSNCDLSNQKLIKAINALETAGIIGVGRAEEILKI